MHWYLAKLVFRIVCGEGKHTAQFDEQLRLIQAVNRQEAFRKARELGMEEEDHFENQQKEMVHWEFIDVSELNDLEGIADKSEIYSRVHEEERGDLYEAQIRKRSEKLSEILGIRSPQTVNSFT